MTSTWVIPLFSFVEDLVSRLSSRKVIDLSPISMGASDWAGKTPAGLDHRGKQVRNSPDIDIREKPVIAVSHEGRYLRQRTATRSIGKRHGRRQHEA
jgi:hypothetical protein